MRFAEHFVDPALGFCTGINFFVFEAILIPFEMVAFNIVLHFWTDKIPVAGIMSAFRELFYNSNNGIATYISVCRTVCLSTASVYEQLPSQDVCIILGLQVAKERQFTV